LALKLLYLVLKKGTEYMSFERAKVAKVLTISLFLSVLGAPGMSGEIDVKNKSTFDANLSIESGYLDHLVLGDQNRYQQLHREAEAARSNWRMNLSNAELAKKVREKDSALTVLKDIAMLNTTINDSSKFVSVAAIKDTEKSANIDLSRVSSKLRLQVLALFPTETTQAGVSK